MFITGDNDNIYNISAVKGKDGRPVIVYSTCTADKDIHGYIYMVENSKTTRLTESGDYEALRTILFNDTVYTVCTSYINNAKTVLLIISNGSTTKNIELTPAGKYDNPEIVSHNGKLCVLWEKAEAEGNSVEFVTVNPYNIDEISCISKITDKGERAYRPRAVSDGENLFIAYEAFFNKRYNIIFRIKEKEACGFSQAVNAGFEKFNDTTINLCVSQKHVYFTWENSSPIYTDYRWLEGSGIVIKMPSYGHGWRVRARSGIRRLRIADHKIIIENPVSSDNKNIILCGEESDGESVIFIQNEIPVLVYLSKAEEYFWKVKADYLNGNEFCRLDLPHIVRASRKQPLIVHDGTTLYIFGDIVSDGFNACEIYEVNLVIDKKEIKYNEIKNEPINEFSSAENYMPEKHGCINYNNEKLNLYWGDLHMHSNISRCSLHQKFHCTEIEQKHRFSRDAGYLDFDLLTDHEVMSDFQWLMTKKAANMANYDGSFVSFVGFEWTSSMLKDFNNYGHYNVLYKDDGDIRRIQTGEYADIEALWASLEKGSALTIPHHPSEEMHPLDWDHFNPDFEPLVEIYQVRGSYEYDDCELKPENYGRRVVKNNSVREGLKRGYRFGFTAGGEHEGVGLTGVYAKELTRQGIFDALVNRRTYGTTSEKIFIDFRVDGSLFGSIIKKSDPNTEIYINIKGTASIKNLVLVSSLWEKEIPVTKDECVCKTVSYTFEKLPEWMYLRLLQEDGNAAWTSPVWIIE